jgi:hypothetical protein
VFWIGRLIRSQRSSPFRASAVDAGRPAAASFVAHRNTGLRRQR